MLIRFAWQKCSLDNKKKRYLSKLEVRIYHRFKINSKIYYHDKLFKHFRIKKTNQLLRDKQK